MTRRKVWRIDLATGSERESKARLQLERLLVRYDLTRWIFTTHIRIESGGTPHSHPVLTLNTRYLDRDELALATFLHEQIHWFEDARPSAVRAATSELRALYPDVPKTLPEGGRSDSSTYLHLIVNYLEYAALCDLLGSDSARQILKNHQVYTWIYQTVLRDAKRIHAVLERRDLIIK